MDDNFFKKLDDALTNVGSDKHWERKVGGRVVWFSTVPFKGQHKINDLLTNQDLGANIFAEVKRETLSYAIVGFDGFDLRPYRDQTVFPVVNREKKTAMVSLNKYLHSKMDEWGIEWIDSAFDVFTDIMTTVKKENLAEVKFENARDKKEELAELEEKVRELRIELMMPPLVEAKLDDEAPEPEAEGPEAAPALRPAARREAPAPEPEPAKFDPFQRIPDEEFRAPAPAPAPARQPPSVPVPVPPQRAPIQPRPRLPGMESATSTPDSPYLSSRADDVLERPAAKDQDPPKIVIDPPQGNVNPRFNPGGR